VFAERKCVVNYIDLCNALPINLPTSDVGRNEDLKSHYKKLPVVTESMEVELP